MSDPTPTSPPSYSRFESEMLVRPSDIDMNQHVHNSHYLDYVLAARYDQMERCYKMSMEEFLALGFGWVVRSVQLEYKRPLGLGDRFVVATWVESIERTDVRVGFEILRAGNRKQSCGGSFRYTMVNLESGRAQVIPDEIRERYSV